MQEWIATLKTVELRRLRELLAAIQAAGDKALPDAVRQFQSTVWDAETIAGATEIEEDLLRSLAYDLDFTDSTSSVRAVVEDVAAQLASGDVRK